METAQQLKTLLLFQGTQVWFSSTHVVGLMTACNSSSAVSDVLFRPPAPVFMCTYMQLKIKKINLKVSECVEKELNWQSPQGSVNWM